MGISFFTKTPFSVTVNEKTYELSKKEKTAIVIAGIVGLALLLVGAVFTFYGMSYLLRQHKVAKITAAPLHMEATPTQNQVTTALNSNSIEEIKKMTVDIVNGLKNRDELKSINYMIYYGSKSNCYEIEFSETPVMKLSERLPKELEHAFGQFESKQVDQINWAIIAEDKNGIYHAVHYNSKNSQTDFYKDVILNDLPELKKIITKRVTDFS